MSSTVERRPVGESGDAGGAGAASLARPKVKTATLLVRAEKLVVPSAEDFGVPSV